jgi:hypothetical protein
MVRASVELMLGTVHTQGLGPLCHRQIAETHAILEDLTHDPKTAILMLLGDVQQMELVRCCCDLHTNRSHR